MGVEVGEMWKEGGEVEVDGSIVIDSVERVARVRRGDQ